MTRTKGSAEPYAPPETTRLEPAGAADTPVNPQSRARIVLRLLVYMALFSLAGTACRFLGDVLYFHMALPSVIESAFGQEAGTTLPFALSLWQLRLATALLGLPLAAAIAWGAGRLWRRRTPWLLVPAIASFAEGFLSSSAGVLTPSIGQCAWIFAGYGACFLLLSDWRRTAAAPASQTSGVHP
jgi:hypothetical protein